MNKNIIKTKDQIQKELIKLAKKINRDYFNKEIILICLNDSAKYFVKDLKKLLKIKFIIDTLRFKNYKETSFSGEVKILKDLNYNICKRHVIIVDGIIISGITHSYLSKYLNQRGPKSIALMAVGKKINHIKKKIPRRYTLFSFTDEWVEGYGFGSEKYKNKNYLVDARKK